MIAGIGTTGGMPTFGAVGAVLLPVIELLSLQEGVWERLP
jgi:hypothetical protein